MPKSDLVDRAFDDLAHSLRVLLEAHLRANRGGLLFVDRAEAVGNIETALTAALNAFHSLYDALSKHPLGKAVDWHANGALATVLAIRNARHHNKANKIRTLYSYHVQEARQATRMEMYVLVDFPSTDPTAVSFELYLSWADLRTLMTMPPKESQLRVETRDTIGRYLGSAKFGEFAAYFGQPESQVFFNMIPLLANAGRTIFPAIKSLLTGLSTESEAFAAIFDQPAQIILDHPDVNCGPFVLAE